MKSTWLGLLGVTALAASMAACDQNVTRPDPGLWHLGGTKATLAVFLDDECFHVRSNDLRLSRGP